MTVTSIWIGIIVGLITIIGGISAYTVTVFKLGKFTAALNENTRMTIETYNTVKSHDKRISKLEENQVDKEMVIRLKAQHDQIHKGD